MNEVDDIAKHKFRFRLIISTSAPGRSRRAVVVQWAWLAFSVPGLRLSQPFEAWFVFDKSFDPMIQGYAVPAGATIRFVFPQEFTP
jgi:hypothetical protein